MFNSQYTGSSSGPPSGPPSESKKPKNNRVLGTKLTTNNIGGPLEESYKRTPGNNPSLYRNKPTYTFGNKGLTILPGITPDQHSAISKEYAIFQQKNSDALEAIQKQKEFAAEQERIARKAREEQAALEAAYYRLRSEGAMGVYDATREYGYYSGGARKTHKQHKSNKSRKLSKRNVKSKSRKNRK
jgi:hypothetical protein